jgi:hypothetical protein
MKAIEPERVERYVGYLGEIVDHTVGRLNQTDC